MPLQAYGVLTARAIDRHREGSGDTPHYQIHLVDGRGTHFRAAVNVQSQERPSELLYLVEDELRHPVTTALARLGDGWHQLSGGSGGAALDYVRGNLFDPARMRTLPADAAGADNDLADLLDLYVQRAIADDTARLSVFGQRWRSELAVKDKVFGFLPGNGVHDVHMNQGNSARFRRDDGVWQDGGLLLYFPRDDRWVGIFLAFQSQAWHTDDATGHALVDAPPRDDGVGPAVRILAALVNPVGPAPERETVLLINASPEPVDMAGWRLADRARHTCEVGATTLAPGATVQVAVRDGVQLGNRGGSITLLDRRGLKVSGVAYSADQADPEGWTVTF